MRRESTGYVVFHTKPSRKTIYLIINNNYPTIIILMVGPSENYDPEELHSSHWNSV